MSPGRANNFFCATGGGGGGGKGSRAAPDSRDVSRDSQRPRLPWESEKSSFVHVGASYQESR